MCCEASRSRLGERAQRFSPQRVPRTGGDGAGRDGADEPFEPGPSERSRPPPAAAARHRSSRASVTLRDASPTDAFSGSADTRIRCPLEGAAPSSEPAAPSVRSDPVSLRSPPTSSTATLVQDLLVRSRLGSTRCLPRPSSSCHHRLPLPAAIRLRPWRGKKREKRLWGTFGAPLGWPRLPLDAAGRLRLGGPLGGGDQQLARRRTPAPGQQPRGATPHRRPQDESSETSDREATSINLKASSVRH